MQYSENNGIAAFRSRQQVMRFDSALRRAGIHSEIVSTPRDVSIGCGLSVAFDLRDTAAVMDTYRRSRPGNLIGFYEVIRAPGQRAQVMPLNMGG
ncbi:MAG: DUF3343 domain-containing protein [Clostridia bacterium]|nr:DUF3343 domain-containing protein [Clostridia bacterium]MBR0408978.1 DUF3343 domain-containing protein [Clostridia bacterium]